MLEILYQDEYLVAVNKPAGMLVHRSWLDTHETQFVMQTLRDQIGQHVFPIHRLDRPTSGVLLFALNSEMANLMCQQFEQKTVQKSYLAIVRGYLQGKGRIDYPLKIQLDKIADKFYYLYILRILYAINTSKFQPEAFKKAIHKQITDYPTIQEWFIKDLYKYISFASLNSQELYLAYLE